MSPLNIRSRISVSFYRADGVIIGMGIIHPDSFDESTHIHGAYDHKLYYYDTVEKVVKLCAENSATVSHTGSVTQGTLVQVTNISPNSKVNVTNVGLLEVDDGFLDIATDTALGELEIKVITPYQKPVEWQLEVVSP